MTPDRPSDPPLRTLILDHGPLAWAEDGEGCPIVALHGLPGSARDFRWLGAAVDGVRLVRLELPGFGATPLATGPDPSAEGRADVVIAAARALGLDRYVVLGHSMGGAVASAVAARDPERVAGLALVASVGVRPHRALRAIGAPRLLSAILKSPLRRPMMPLLRGQLARGGFRGHDDAALVHAMHCVAGTSLDRHGARLAALRVPTLIAWSDDDPMVEGAIGDQLDQVAPAGPRLRFEDGGHNLQKSRAVELAAALRDWAIPLAGARAS